MHHAATSVHPSHGIRSMWTAVSLVFVDAPLVLGNARGAVRADDDALPREKVDDVRIPVAGAGVPDLVTEQELRQLRDAGSGCGFTYGLADHPHIVDEVRASPQHEHHDRRPSRTVRDGSHAMNAAKHPIGRSTAMLK